MKRLEKVEPLWPAGGNGAEPAGAGADVAEDHERCRAAAEAFTDVGAVRFLADRV